MIFFKAGGDEYVSCFKKSQWITTCQEAQLWRKNILEISCNKKEYFHSVT